MLYATCLKIFFLTIFISLLTGPALAANTFPTTGNAGAGTASPVNQLDVSGAMAIGSSYAGTDTAPSNGLIVQGAVGIGTTSPIQALDIGTGAFRTGNLTIVGNPVAFANPLTINGQTPPAFMYLDSTYGALRIGSQGSSGYSYIDFEMPSNSTQYQDVMQLTSSQLAPASLFDNTINLGVSGQRWKSLWVAGNGVFQGDVGIGTTSPSYTLQVDPSTTGVIVQLGPDYNGGTPYNTGNKEVDIDSWNGTVGLRLSNNGHQNFLATVTTSGLYTLQDSTNTYFGLTGGNVGIGTTSPGVTLDVAGQARAISSSYPVVLGQRETTSGSGLLTTINAVAHTTTGSMSNGFGPIFGWQIEGSDSVYHPLVNIGGVRDGGDDEGDMVFNTYVSGSETERMRILNNGDVGIGTSSPTYTLQVNGSVAGTSAYVNTSDVRKKKHIAPLNAGLKEVELLKPVTFEWKDPKDKNMTGQQIGFIAQDVEKVLPSVVLTEDDKEKTKAMKYTEIIPVLTKAIQQQEVKIDALEAEIEALKARADRN